MSSKKSGDWVLKIAILGDAGVGKTSLVNQFVDNSFKEDYKATIGANILKKDVKLPQLNSTAKMVLWDIAGQTQYEKARSAYYEGCSGALLVYDITRYSSFDNISARWLSDYRKHVKKEQLYILVGNKNDLEHQRGVNNEDGASLAEKIEALEFIETSAKDNINVNEAFTKLAEAIIKLKTS
ncbi:MAG: Small GTP-binding domain protein [Promethearchaeota archaeon]|nr:MAG: Small GTP-binding domain protein [Candidatus Lokiarchaeota archaeon]